MILRLFFLYLYLNQDTVYRGNFVLCNLRLSMHASKQFCHVDNSSSHSCVLSYLIIDIEILEFLNSPVTTRLKLLKIKRGRIIPYKQYIHYFQYSPPKKNPTKTKNKNKQANKKNQNNKNKKSTNKRTKLKFNFKEHLADIISHCNGVYKYLFAI